MDSEVQAYRDSVEADFKIRKFCECSFKGKNNWYEILDISVWNWNTFDYRIPSYTKSKSINEIIDNTDKFVSEFK